MLKFLFTFICAWMLFIIPGSRACDLAYEVRSDDVVSELCVTIVKKAEGITYRSTYRDVKQLYYYNADSSLMRWEYVDMGEQTDFQASRTEGDILIRGRSRGEPVTKSLPVGNQVWLQNSEFGLLEFLKSQEKSQEFVMIAPEDLSIKKFKVSRGAKEEIVRQDKKIQVIKLTARLRGFLSLFWQATYWHRLPEMTFIRYKADGLPGVPKVDIQLLREKGMR